MEFQRASQRRGDLFQYQSGNDALANDTWNDLVEKRLLEDNYEDLGLMVTKEEFDDIRFGENISPYVSRTFYQNQPNPQKIEQQRQMFAQMYQGRRATWEGYKDFIIQNRKREKFNELVNRGLYANSLEAESNYVMQNKTVSFDFVLKQFNTIPDSVVTVEESDVRKYYNAHKNEDQYQQTVSRSFDYITFDVTPTAEDSAKIRTELAKLKDEFAAADDDSLYVVNNSKVNRFTPRKYRGGDISGPQDSLIMNASVGDVVGPFIENGNYKLMKVLESGEITEVNASHILLKSGPGKDLEVLKTRIDSLKKVIQNNDNFAEMARQFSEDGSAQKGGDLGWFGEGRMVAPFQEVAFDTPVGKMGVAETQFGVHLIRVDDKRTEEEVSIAEIGKPIIPSSETMKEAFKEANEFSLLYNTAEDFKNAADTVGYNLRSAKDIGPKQNNLPGGLSNAGPVVSWAFNAEKVGAVSNPIAIGDSYILAVLTRIKEKGVPPFENVQEVMRAEVVKEKKAELYEGKMVEGENLQAVADNVNETVKTATSINMNRNNIPGGGNNEPKVIGMAFAIEKGKMSYPIVGEAGIYVIAPTNEPSTPAGKETYASEKEQLNKGFSSSALRVFNGMKDAVEIENRTYQY
jgi:peptidyl-prolyl cis-trans isomerase D